MPKGGVNSTIFADIAKVVPLTAYRVLSTHHRQMSLRQSRAALPIRTRTFESALTGAFFLPFRHSPDNQKIKKRKKQRNPCQ